MKNIVYSSFFIISFLFCSCSKDDSIYDEPKLDIEPEPIEYYVKYEYKFGSYLNLAKVAHVQVVTENGVQSFDLRPSSTFWEGVFGPFKDCKSLSITASADQAYPNLNMHARISISKGGPFVLKAQEDKYTQKIQLVYRVTKRDIK
ncbi:hypothetical protein [uncultured Duncaniella sp.]|uniref:hypothetical protein n=1 Tax=uncultured Duncaniella sp. TaxID=2768039 RepID=UPI0025B0BA52|nr:hypothetical protein [uncultured Duncaniella sp.]